MLYARPWFVCAGIAVVLVASARAQEAAAASDAWVARFRFEEPRVGEQGICAGTAGDLPAFSVDATRTGLQVVRVSLPFAPGGLPKGLGLKARHKDVEFPVDLRVLTWHPGKPASVRRGIVTFAYDFPSAGTHRFELLLAEPEAPAGTAIVSEGTVAVALNDTRVELSSDGFKIYRNGGAAPTFTGSLVFTGCAPSAAATGEVVECGSRFIWARVIAPADKGARIVELKLDALGTVAIQAQVQQTEHGVDTAPDFGWRVAGPAFAAQPPHSFADGQPFELRSADGNEQIAFPVAPHDRRGRVELGNEVVFLRCAADEKVPFQDSTWRRAAVVIGKPGNVDWTPLLEPRANVTIDGAHFDRVYRNGDEPALDLWPVLGDLRAYTLEAITKSMLEGDDFGNVSIFNENAPAGVNGMNRLNHGEAMFEEAWRSGNRALLDTILLWCSNMYDLSIWWGEGETVGGTRYNNALAAGDKTHEGDTNYMWRLNEASTFCTKGIDSFYLAYEETGDPRMLAAFRAQVAYAKKYVHVNTGEARNIGDAADFMRLYRWTGQDEYRQEALRLFMELREKLSPGDLFSQGGQLIVPDGPFIDDDGHGYEAPYAKPYIMGYALAGLPDLLLACPDEPRLRDVVRAVADFLASSADPAGGWRYPHPRSSRTLVSQGMEHAAQLVRAAKVLEARGEPIDSLLDAIETVLQTRVKGFERTGTILSNLAGWEQNPGAIPEGKTVYDLYVKPADRDPSRDYTEGAIGIGSAPPEGLVYFGEVLSYYLSRRPAERLFNANDKLKLVLDRAPDRRLRLTPQGNGAELSIQSSESPETAFVLAAPEWVSFPNVAKGEALTLDWKRDDTTGTVWYTLEREEGTFTAAYVPHVEYVECFYTVCPKPGVTKPAEFAVGLAPESNEAVTPVGAEGKWVRGLSVEGGADACDHCSEGNARAHLNADGPTTLRVNVYLLKGSAEDVAARRERDRARWAKTVPAPPAAIAATQRYGMRAKLPVFSDARVQRMEFPLGQQASGLPLEEWRTRARSAYLETLQTPPPRAPFNAQVLAVEDRGPYEARKLALNLSADSRVEAYLLVPKGEGPFPAVLALHDHGAHFTIGKEKVIKPFGVAPERLQDAQDWVNQCYGGNWFGDELAKRGYVVFAVDALFWGDRGRFEGADHSEQQALAANMLQLGMAWSGNIVWDDIRSAEFVQSLPEVHPERIGCMGLSMGAHRTWSLCAATDIVKCGAAICWMGDTPTLTSEGNNQTTGQSSFSMLLPGVRNLLDYPDVASIACPKPMLFFNGTQDGLFPVPGGEASYAKIRAVWESDGAGEKLVTRLWDVPHVFNAEMQAEAFAWLDRWLGVNR